MTIGWKIGDAIRDENCWIDSRKNVLETLLTEMPRGAKGAPANQAQA
jgi:hypothetical protein